jgi:hypothetical protein
MESKRPGVLWYIYGYETERMSKPICHTELYSGWAADSYFFDINHRLERVPRRILNLGSLEGQP